MSALLRAHKKRERERAPFGKKERERAPFGKKERERKRSLENLALQFFALLTTLTFHR